MLKNVNKKIKQNEIKDILGDCKKYNNLADILKKLSFYGKIKF